MDQPTSLDEMLPTKKAAAILGLAQQTLAIDRCTGRLGKVPFYRIGRRVYYRRSDLEAWLQARRH